MENYYKIKQTYEKKKNTAFKKIYNNNDFTLAEKREKVKNYKQSCIECKRKVNTIFFTDNNMLKAKCGNNKSPCKLNIQVEKTKTKPIHELITEIEENINKLKETITTTKLNFLFKYANEDETLKVFESKKTQLNSLNEYLHSLKQELKEKNNMEERNTIINDNMNIFYETLKIIKNNINEYNTTNKIQYLKDKAQINKETMLPILKNIRNSKFDTSLVETEIDENKNTFYKLYNVKNSILRTEKTLKI